MSGPDDLKWLFGRRWPYKLKVFIALVAIAEYPTPGHALADGMSPLGLKDLTASAIEIRGQRPLGEHTLPPADCASTALVVAFVSEVLKSLR